MAPRWTAEVDLLRRDCVYPQWCRLDDLIVDLESFIPQAEASLLTGRRITEPDRPMTARGVRRRRTELAQARDGLAAARVLLAARRTAPSGSAGSSRGWGRRARDDDSEARRREDGSVR